MERMHIIAGFSDIKSELRTKTQINKLLTNLRLWFSYNNGILCAHDYHEHNKNIILVVFNSSENTWRLFLRENSYGKNLVMDIVYNTPQDKILVRIRALYAEYGFY